MSAPAQAGEQEFKVAEIKHTTAETDEGQVRDLEKQPETETKTQHMLKETSRRTSMRRDLTRLLGLGGDF